MSEKDHNAVGRRRLLTGMGTAAVAGLAVGSVSADTDNADFQPARHDLDAWMGQLPGSHRVFIDSSTVEGGGNAIRFANNIIASHIEEYDGKASDYALIVCFRHASTPYGFGNGLWAKYGKLINRNPKIEPPTTNPMYTANDYSGPSTIETLLEKGVHFAICKRASRRAATNIAKATGMSVDEAFAELVAGAIPNSHFVAAGVLAATRSQEYRYSLLYAE